MSKYSFLGLGLAFLGGVALGGGIGYKFSVSQLDDKYNELMEEEIARTRKFYERVHKAGDFETPAGAAEAMGVDIPLEEAADALAGYQGKVDYTKFYAHELSLNLDENPFVKAAGIPSEEAIVVGEPIEQNVFDQAEDIGFTKRDPDKPYQITMLEFAENETDYEQLSATYFAGDNVLTDDQDQPVDPMEPVVGFGRDAAVNVDRFGGQNVIYVRNERLKTDYEVNKSDGKYAYEVAGFTHGDETFERRPRRRSADE
jgi:hypothetical protein